MRITNSLRTWGIVLKYTGIVLLCLLLIVPVVFILYSCPEGAQMLMGLCEAAGSLFGGVGDQKGSDQNLS